MAQSNIDRALARGGPWCPVCKAEAVAGGPPPLTTEQRAGIKALCDKVATEAAAPLNAEEMRRRAEIQKGRAHKMPKRSHVHTGRRLCGICGGSGTFFVSFESDAETRCNPCNGKGYVLVDYTEHNRSSQRPDGDD